MKKPDFERLLLTRPTLAEKKENAAKNRGVNYFSSSHCGATRSTGEDAVFHGIMVSVAHQAPSSYEFDLTVKALNSGPAKDSL
jgi:hypothetical protein